jgi:hypothetical protein
VPSLRTWRQATVAGSLSLVGVDAFEAAQHHGTAGEDFELGVNVLLGSTRAYLTADPS